MDTYHSMDLITIEGAKAFCMRKHAKKMPYYDPDRVRFVQVSTERHPTNSPYSNFLPISGARPYTVSTTVQLAKFRTIQVPVHPCCTGDVQIVYRS